VLSEQVLALNSAEYIRGFSSILTAQIGRILVPLFVLRFKTRIAPSRGPALHLAQASSLDEASGRIDN
jgi:hypothetical protein